MTDNLLRRSNESESEYKKRIYLYRDIYGLTWEDIADIINSELNSNYSADKYRKESYKVLDSDHSQVLKVDDKLLEYKKEKIKLNDQRTQITALTRLAAREEAFKDIAIEVANNISKEKILDIPKRINIKNEEKKAILCIGDWHYGLEVDLFYNTYNTEIAVERITPSSFICLAQLGKGSFGEVYLVQKINTQE